MKARRQGCCYVVVDQYLEDIDVQAESLCIASAVNGHFSDLYNNTHLSAAI